MADPVSTHAVDALKAELRELSDIRRALSALGWDELTHMPPGGAPGRAESTATLERIAHTRLTSARMGDLIEAAEDDVSGLDTDSDDFNLVRVIGRDYRRSARMPHDLVAERARARTLANSAWEVAKRNDDYALFAPWLQKNIELDRQLAEAVGYQEHPFDALIEADDPGVTASSMRAIFAALRPSLVDLVQRVARNDDVGDDLPTRGLFDEAAQERVCRDVAERIGYDFSRGDLDRTVHPFMTSFGRDDVRITTRYDAQNLPVALLGTVHEAGHALYEQGIDVSLDRTMLDIDLPSGMHESQSRLWENFVGRGLPFWQYYYPTVQAAFPDALAAVDITAFHRAINRVQPSCIRMEADEVTYSLHIMLRFELELALFEGEIAVADAPEAWNAAMRTYLGITPPNNREGILQDVHWTAGFGHFQGYALGNIIAAQLWEAVDKAHPDLPDLIRNGQFRPLLDWLRVNIHRHGRKYDSADLVQRATGVPLSTEPYIRYLSGKFGAIAAPA